MLRKSCFANVILLLARLQILQPTRDTWPRFGRDSAALCSSERSPDAFERRRGGGRTRSRTGKNMNTMKKMKEYWTPFGHLSLSLWCSCLCSRAGPVRRVLNTGPIFSGSTCVISIQSATSFSNENHAWGSPPFQAGGALAPMLALGGNSFDP